MSNSIQVSMGLKGKFLLEVKHADGTSDNYEAPNMIVNSGLDYIGGGTGTAINGIAVGTGNSTPVATQSQLDAGIAYTTATPTMSQSFVSTPPYIAQNNYVFTFGVGAVVGNIAEIAAIPTGSTHNTGVVFSRALIQVGGSPGVITLLSTDQLIVTYQLQAIQTADITGSLNVVIDGTPTAYSYTIRPIGFYASSLSPYYGQKSGIAINIGGSGPGWYPGLTQETALHAVTASPDASTTTVVQWYYTSPTLGSYTSGTFQRTATFTSPSGNTGPVGFGTFAFNWFSFQIYFNGSTFPYLSTQTLSWPVTISWANVP